MTGWMRRKRFDESAFLLRHLEIKTALALRVPADLDAELDSVPPMHR